MTDRLRACELKMLDRRLVEFFSLGRLQQKKKVHAALDCFVLLVFFVLCYWTSSFFRTTINYAIVRWRTWVHSPFTTNVCVGLSCHLFCFRKMQWISIMVVMRDGERWLIQRTCGHSTLLNFDFKNLYSMDHWTFLFQCSTRKICANWLNDSTISYKFSSYLMLSVKSFRHLVFWTYPFLKFISL